MTPAASRSVAQNKWVSKLMWRCGESVWSEREYWNIKNFTVKMDLGKVHIQLDNLFNGAKVLGKNINKFLNENMNLLVQDLKPGIELA
ncbi:protein takeout-like [Schistocerca cancellata]|uniref:protein takeout-like n=1 Tax=Schistocerca cancellata TaxID=274614 RepID=UPI0021176A3A|nr:protein takeout-like [Schistocerca cancellata]